MWHDLLLLMMWTTLCAHARACAHPAPDHARPQARRWPSSTHPARAHTAGPKRVDQLAAQAISALRARHSASAQLTFEQDHPHELRILRTGQLRAQIWLHLDAAAKPSAPLPELGLGPPWPPLYVSLRLQALDPGYGLDHALALSRDPRSPRSSRPVVRFGSPFDELLSLSGPADVLMARYDALTRQRLTALAQQAHQLRLEGGQLSVTWRLYVVEALTHERALDQALDHALERAMEALALGPTLLDPVDVPARLLEALKREQDPAQGAALLKALLRHHELTAQGQGAIKWALRQPLAHHHAVMAQVCPHLLERERRLAPLLFEHAGDVRVLASVRELALGQLARARQEDAALHALLGRLSLSEPDERLRALALEHALRLCPLATTSLDAATLTLSARAALRAGHLEPLQRDRIERLMQGAHARLDWRAHMTVARDHADRAARYASLCALLPLRSCQAPLEQALRLLLELAALDPDQLVRERATSALAHEPEAQARLDLLAQDPSLGPLARLMAATLTRPLQTHTLLERWRDPRVVALARQRALEAALHAQDFPDEALLALALEVSAATCRRDALALWGLLTSPRHLGRVELSSALRLLDDATLAALCDAMSQAHATYSAEQRLRLSLLGLTLLELPSLTVWTSAVGLVRRVASPAAACALREAIAQARPLTPKHSPRWPLLLELERLLASLLERAGALSGALSLSSAHDPRGALSAASPKGQLSLTEGSSPRAQKLTRGSTKP